MSETTDSQPMSGIDGTEPTTVSRDGLTVEKSIDHHRDDVVKVSLAINSTREEPVRLQLVDQLPEEVETDRVGFHPEYDPDGWHVGADRTVVYEAVIAPGEAIDTVYGVRVSTPDQLERMSGRPSLEVMPAANDGADDEADRTSPADESERPIPNIEVESIDTDGPTVEFDRESPEPPGPDGSSVHDDGLLISDPSPAPDASGDGGQPADAEAAPAAAAEAHGGVAFAGSGRPGGSAASVDVTEGSIVAAVVDELRSRELRDAERATIRDALDLEAATSERVRLDHVQATVDDLVAYRDALEGFIDEHGPAEAVIEEFRAGLAERAAELDALQETVADLCDRLESLEDDHDADAGRLESRLEEVQADLTGARTTLEDDLEAVRGDLERLMEWREKLSVAAQLADVGVESNSATD